MVESRSRAYREWTFEGDAERFMRVGTDGLASVTGQDVCWYVVSGRPPRDGKLGGTAEFYLPRQRFSLSGFYIFKACERTGKEDIP